MSALLLLRAVAAASLLAVLHALGVERAADDLVADTRQVLHATAAHEHHRVLLQVVTDTGDVGGDLHPGGEADTGHLAQSGVRLLGSRGVHPGAHTATLGRTLERRRLVLAHLVRPALADQLLNCGHCVLSLSLGLPRGAARTHCHGFTTRIGPPAPLVDRSARSA